MKRKSVILLVSAACAVAVLMAFVGGCGGSKQADMKLVVIGIDGMEWKLVDPLLEQGKMPNLARVVRNGMRADLRSLEPREKSPTIWTTMATGKGPQKHGIADFIQGGSEQPLFNSLGWRARSVWNILGEKGRTVGVIGWLMTWPAQPVNGYIVTDRIVYSPEDGFDPIPDSTYPKELSEELQPEVVSVAATTDDDVAGLLNGDTWSGTDEENFAWGGVQTLKGIIANDRSILNIFKHMQATRPQPDFTAVYVLGLDRCCHRFWGPMQPWTVDIAATDEFNNTFKDVIPRYYERIDGMIGEILDSIDPNSTVIICSDHGFRGPNKTKEGLQLGIQMHSLVGVFAAMGPGIRKGGNPRDASVLDITPTILALFGEPVGRDMDGLVIDQAIDQKYLESHPVSYIETYETGEKPAEQKPLESSVDDEIKEQLRSLGYID